LAEKTRINNSLLVVVILMISLAWFYKNSIFIRELNLDMNLLHVSSSSVAVGLIISSFFLSRPTMVKGIFSLFIYTILTFLLYADVVYERYYDAILDFEILSQANQVGTVYESVISLIYLQDLWYWADLPLLLLVFVVFQKNDRHHRGFFMPSLSFGAGIGMIIYLSFTTMTSQYSDQYKVATAGVIPAHIFNSFSSADPVQEPVAAASVETQEEAMTIQERFAFKQELQKESPDFGKYKGKNLIIVQAESLNEFVINLEVDGKEVTPVLNELVDSSHYYPNTYLQIGRGNTSDAEFVVNNSIYPMSDNGAYQGYPDNDYLSLATVLKEEGYETSAAHGNEADFWNRENAYPGQGFETFYHIDHEDIKKDEMIGLGLSDESMFDQMVEQYKEMKQPFYNFIVSLTTHRPFELPKKYSYLELPDEIKGTSTGNYLESVYYFDKALGTFITKLKAEGLWEESIFIVYGDHYGPIPKDQGEIKELLNIDFDEEERFNIPLVIHHPEQTEGERHEVIASQMDIYPTVSQLMGITRPLVQFGTPLDSKEPRVVGFYYETTPYSYYSTTYDYIASHTGVFEDGTCIKRTTEERVNVKRCEKDFQQIYDDIQLSRYLLENNMINQIITKEEL
jgi:lipoteichoic acid synthase